LGIEAFLGQVVGALVPSQEFTGFAVAEAFVLGEEGEELFFAFGHCGVQNRK
jgi:hypothetical protein